MEGQTVTVKGPKATLATQINHAVRADIVQGQDGREVVFLVDEAMASDTNTRAQWGTARANVANLVKGVTTGFTKKLEVNGVGYRVSASAAGLVLNVGFSHEVKVAIPKGIEASVEGNVITLTGADTQAVGELAAQLRAIRKPEPYKGKGIKYADEVVRRKAGKTQKAGA